MGTGAASGLLLAGGTWAHAWASESPPSQPRRKSRICVIFTGTPQPEDRNWGADPKQIEAMKARLAAWTDPSPKPTNTARPKNT